MPYGLESIDQRQQARALKGRIKRLIQHELEEGMDLWWFISFHYNDGKTNEDQVIKDIADLKIKLKREIYRRRDKRIKGAGSFPYPKMLVMNEVSHLGTGQFHSHLITEAFPERLNSQRMMELLFKRILPSKSRHYRDGKVLMSRGSIKTQKISSDWLVIWESRWIWIM